MYVFFLFLGYALLALVMLVVGSACAVGVLFYLFAYLIRYGYSALRHKTPPKWDVRLPNLTAAQAHKFAMRSTVWVIGVAVVGGFIWALVRTP